MVVVCLQAGDAASFFTQWKRRRLRCDHIENAAETGALAGTNMTGYWEPNNIEPHFKFFFEDKLTVEVTHAHLHPHTHTN